jgi:hypothetical protein
MASGYAQFRYESTPGNEDNVPTLSTKTLYPPLIEFQPELNPAHLNRDDELRNQGDEPLMALPERYAPEWSLTSRSYPDTIAYFLKLALGEPTSTAGNGIITDPDGTPVPTGATRHVWTAPFGPVGVNPLTSQIQAAYVDQTTYFKLKGAGISTLGIETPESGGGRINASGMALFMDRISNPSLTPSYESLAIRPFTRGDLQIVTWLSGTATFEDFDVSIANPLDATASLGISSRFPDLLEKGDDPISFTGSVPKRVIDDTDYDALVNATGFTTKARWQSASIIASLYPYSMWIQHDNAQYLEGGPNALANTRRIGARFTYKATSDGAGASTTVTVVNATSSYA